MKFKLVWGYIIVDENEASFSVMLQLVSTEALPTEDTADRKFQKTTQYS